MDKQQIFDAFDGKISKKAIQKVDGEWRIIGKDCEIEYLGNGFWDFYVCNRQNMAKGVNQIRVNQILDKFSLLNRPVTVLNGEGYAQGSLEEIKSVVLPSLSYFGIRKKREVSAEQMEKVRSHIGGK